MVWLCLVFENECSGKFVKYEIFCVILISGIFKLCMMWILSVVINLVDWCCLCVCVYKNG